MSEMDDDHYIPDGQNAHIDTSDFERELEDLAGPLHGWELDEKELWPAIHDRVMGRISNPPDEPPDDALICRYLTPAKFLWFVSQMTAYFGRASGFEDRSDCSLPDDYYSCVQRFFMDREVVPIEWDDHADRMRSRWLISCWTELNDHHDDYLLWHRYAGGPLGVGVSLRYGVLRDQLRAACDSASHVESFLSGYVSYRFPLRFPPFNKRRIFRNEKEIRFACRTDVLASISPSVDTLKEHMGLRFSPDAPREHVESVMATWLRWGGPERFQIAGSR